VLNKVGTVVEWRGSEIGEAGYFSGSFTVRIWSLEILRNSESRPDGHLISSWLRTVSVPKPKWVGLALDEA
jgi:hypothetical protein